MLESIVYPSKVISDQYRSTQFVTTTGQTILGLASAPQNGVITVLQSVGTKVMLKTDEIAQQRLPRQVSNMPEKLLDSLESFRRRLPISLLFWRREPAK